MPMCLLVNEHLSLLARKFPEVKFLKAIVNSCIQNYDDRCLPTILVYKTGEIKGRFIGVAECGGIYVKVEGMKYSKIIHIIENFMLFVIIPSKDHCLKVEKVFDYFCRKKRTKSKELIYVILWYKYWISMDILQFHS